MNIAPKVARQPVSIARCQAFWRIQEEILDLKTRESSIFFFDIYVPLSQVESLITEAINKIKESTACVRIAVYGHVGDGKVSFTFITPKPASTKEVSSLSLAITDVVSSVALKASDPIFVEHSGAAAKRDKLSKSSLRPNLTFIGISRMRLSL